ncbi:VOC family protein [Pseudonocardiaceae bacterium YIM PH 21723]|nr:VOC family protein [Pseudonocardiaceae bacterium YIM PH 21723]
MGNIKRLNHAVLWVREVAKSVDFYTRVLGFTVIDEIPGGRGAFLRAGGSDNHHDLGLFAVGAQAPGQTRGGVGLYHLAWQVDEISELATLADALKAEGALVGATDHGTSKSLYAKDPDGIEFEIMFLLPAEAWPADTAMNRPLDLQKELATWG